MSGLASGEPSDAVLLRQHADGDPDAFGVLFQRHSGRLWAVALRITCDPDDAADALQDAMISAFRRAADYRGEAAGTTWLHPILGNASPPPPPPPPPPRPTPPPPWTTARPPSPGRRRTAPPRPRPGSTWTRRCGRSRRPSGPR